MNVLSSRLLLGINEFVSVVKPETYSQEIAACRQDRTDSSMFGRKKKRGTPAAAASGPEGSDSDRTLAHEFEPSKAQIKRATRTRFVWALLSSFLLLISVVFLILVEIGNTSVNNILNDIYFIKLDISDIIPVSVPNAVLINSIAQSLGLHDFYTVGLWNYCQGYDGQGTTSCSDPQTLYWFNPVEIIQSQLLAGATSKSKKSHQ